MIHSTLDILAIAAHPDDAEIGAGGTILKSIGQGYKVGILDLTRGELGTRGTAETRDKEARNASEMLGIHHRDNLGLPDGFFEHNKESILRIVEKIRLYQPRLVLTTAPSDRHPDHGRASELVRQACFYSGLAKVITRHNDQPQEPHRPNAVYHFIQDYHLPPDFVIDISEQWNKKIEVLKCFKTQFYDENSVEPETPISGKGFFDFLKARAIEMGRPSGFELAEGFMVDRPAGVNDLFHLL